MSPHPFEQVAAFVAEKSADGIIVTGPVVWQLSGDNGKAWYFMVSTADEYKTWHTDKIATPGVKSREEAERIKVGVMTALCTHRPALQIHDFDDELQEIKFCETIWPGERVTRVRQQVEAERAAQR